MVFPANADKPAPTPSVSGSSLHNKHPAMALSGKPFRMPHGLQNTLPVKCHFCGNLLQLTRVAVCPETSCTLPLPENHTCFAAVSLRHPVQPETTAHPNTDCHTAALTCCADRRRAAESLLIRHDKSQKLELDSPRRMVLKLKGLQYSLW